MRTKCCENNNIDHYFCCTCTTWFYLQAIRVFVQAHLKRILLLPLQALHLIPGFCLRVGRNLRYQYDHCNCRISRKYFCCNSKWLCPERSPNTGCGHQSIACNTGSYFCKWWFSYCVYRKYKNLHHTVSKWSYHTAGLCLQERQFSVVKIPIASSLSFGSSFVSGSALSVRATNSCGSSAASSTTINKGSLATPGTISGSSTSCPNWFRQYSVAAVTGATSYIWTIPAGSSIFGSSTGRTIWVWFGSTSGNITVKAVSACGTSIASTKFITISCTSGIEQSTVKKPASIYPNPATNMATVRFDAAVSEPYTLSISDLAGRLVNKKALNAITGTNLYAFDVSSYLPGTYIVRIQGKTISETLKINIQ